MLTISPYRDVDYDKVKILLDEWGDFDPIWDSRENLKGVIEKDETSVLVAKKDGKIIGSVYVVSLWPKVSWIFRLVVKKEFREKGIGTELIAEVEKRQKARGVTEVGMYVEGSDKKLLEFYGKRGYKSSTGKKFMYLWKKMGAV